ncbi:MAG TPA: chemotaxis protein CheC [Clostridia bacterium]|nr:chemotaxis protein CheC [Clostridia bacterium]
MLSEMEKDVLVEVMNTNIGLAASLLSEMASQKVILSVPELDLKKGNEIDFRDIDRNMADFSKSVMSTLRFGNRFSGNAYIVFPADKAKNLINACTGESSASEDADFQKLSLEDLDVIKEISNIIFNAVIGEFGNLLDVRLEYTFPSIEMTMISDVENTILPEEMHFLSMYTSFLLSESQVKGVIFIALTMNSEKMLIDKIDEMLVELNV